MTKEVKIETINDLHEMFAYEKCKHPLISLLELSKVKFPKESVKITSDLYAIIFKEKCPDGMIYGRQHYDFNSGVLNFIEPGQSIIMEAASQTDENNGWILFFHPNLIRRSSLENKIKNYKYFSYKVNEALHLSDKEKEILERIAREIELEFNSNIDEYSHELMVANIEVLLKYAKRFYNRQFITRQNLNKDTVEKFEEYLYERIYLNNLEESGIPTVKECAKAMFLSANYLSDMLKKETGKTTKEFIYLSLLDKAKEMLLDSEDSVKEIAFRLGFDTPNHFSKLFKKRLGISPSEFREGNQSIN